MKIRRGRKTLSGLRFLRSPAPMPAPGIVPPGPGADFNENSRPHPLSSADQMKPPLSLALTILAFASAAFELQAEQNWARFGGPEGSGRSTETSLPVKWDAASVVWKTTLKGAGQSSVVNWGNR